MFHSLTGQELAELLSRLGRACRLWNVVTTYTTTARPRYQVEAVGMYREMADTLRWITSQM